jgi:Tol biopolymer transport system component
VRRCAGGDGARRDDVAGGAHGCSVDRAPGHAGRHSRADPVDDATGTGPWILYQAVFDDVDLGLVRPDGSQAHRIPGGPGNRWHPDWSPDGTRIAYDHDGPDGPAGIGVVSVGGDDDRIVAPCEQSCLAKQDPAWSPDGRSIALLALEAPTDEHPEGIGFLALLDVASGEERRILDSTELVDDIVTARTPRFSPDGRRIVMGVGNEDGDWALATLTVEGENLLRITDWGQGARPDWSPDGEWIVHQGTENEPPNLRPGVGLYRVRPDGSDREQLTEPEGGARDLYPRYLPDGSAIAFSRCTDLWTCETRLIDPDGANDRLLFGELGRQTVHVIWQPGQDE